MRVGPIVSTLGHVAVLAWAVVGLPGAEPYPSEPVDAMPVELVEISDVTALRLGSKTAEDKPVERASTVETDTPEAPPVEDAGSSQTSQDAPPVPEPSKVAALPDAGAPPPPEPEPAEVSEPEPAPQEAEPAPPEPTPTEQPAETPPPPKETSAAPVQASRTPKSKPTPPKKVTQTATANAESKFNSDKISALLDKQQPSGGGTQTPTGQTALGSAKGKTVSKMTQTELAALVAAITPCWNVPVGATDADQLTVRMQISLNPDGSVSGQPEILNSSSSPFFRTMAEAGRRAVLRCGPYTFLPADKYENWKDVIINFKPDGMFNG
jgi:hypothetical protein